jgi:hypothetical protein
MWRGALRGELGAQRHRAAAQVAAQPRAAAEDLVRTRRAPGAQLLEELVADGPLASARPPWTATSVRAASAAICRNSPPSGTVASPSSSTPPTTSPPDWIAASPATPAGTGTGRPRLRSST